MPDERFRLASLTVVGGALDGRRHDVADVVGEVLIGSDSSCQLCVDLPSISPIHARIWTELGQATARDTSAPRGLYVNSVRVETEAAFGEGDALWLGPPNDPQSVRIQGHFEPWQEVLPTAAGEPVPPARPSPTQAPPTEPPADEGDPFFIAADAAGTEAVAATGTPDHPSSPSTEEPVVIAIPLDEASAAVAAPDEAWAMSEAPALPASPSTPPALSTEPETKPESGDEFFVADVVEAPAAEAPPPAMPPQPSAPPERPVARPGPPAPSGAAPARRPVTASGAPPLPGARPAAKPVAGTAPPAARSPGAPRLPAGAQRPAAAAPGTRTAAPPAAPVRPPGPTPAPVKPAGPRPPQARPPAQTRPPDRPPARPAAARPAAPRPATVERRSGARPSAPRRKGGRGWLRAAALLLATLAALASLAFWYVRGRVRLDGMEPSRVRVGQRALLRGQGFSADADANVVLFEGKRAKVLDATAATLEIEVPEAVEEAGSERNVEVHVERGRRSSAPITVSVLQGPRLHALSPQAAMPGEEVLLAGAGLGLGASVRFGDMPAEITQAEATRIHVVVPELASGTQAPVVVTLGGVDSNAVPFVIGRLPVVTAVEPAGASPGDVVRISGLGFHQDPAENEVQIGDSAALVISSSDGTLEVVVPLLGPGDPRRVVALRVSGGTDVGSSSIEVPPVAEVVEARFVAEPFTVIPGRKHAVVATGLGPTFVFAAAAGRSAAERAFEAQGRLNQAVAVLRTTLGSTVEARGFGGDPVIGLSGRSDVLLEVAAEDAAAYAEDWTGLRGRGGAVTRDRLARWWEAVLRDLVLLLVRGEKPRYAAQLATEGRVLARVYEAARQAGHSGTPRSVLAQGRPPLRDGLRLVGLRVPASVTAPALALAPGPTPASTATPRPARLTPAEGILRGFELEGGERRYLTLSLQKTEGSIAYEGGITVTLPIAALERRGNEEVRFAVNVRGGWRYYIGTWDGQMLAGTISWDAEGKEQVGTFELRR